MYKAQAMTFMEVSNRTKRSYEPHGLFIRFITHSLTNWQREDRDIIKDKQGRVEAICGWTCDIEILDELVAHWASMTVNGNIQRRKAERNKTF